MNDLVERLRQMAGDTHRGWGPAYIERAGRDMSAAADALEAAQTRIEAVRRGLTERPTLDVAETALYAWNLQADEANDWSTLSAEKQESIKAVVAFTVGRTRSAIRALADAKEDRT